MLTEDELDLVRASFRAISPASAEAGAMFYDRLFVLAPRLRAIFPADLESQSAKLMTMLGVVVAQLHELDALRPLVSDVARRHAGYGARPEHFALVGEALLWMLDRRLGESFTPAHHTAWERAFAALAGVMIEEMVAA